MQQEDKQQATAQTPNHENNSLTNCLQEVSLVVQRTAEQCEGNSENLLALLRTLESLHRQIRTDLFEPSLPNTRKALYDLLRDMDETGGWPYIERMKIQAFLKNLSLDTKKTPDSKSLNG